MTNLQAKRASIQQLQLIKVTNTLKCESNMEYTIFVMQIHIYMKVEHKTERTYSENEILL